MVMEGPELYTHTPPPTSLASYHSVENKRRVHATPSCSDPHLEPVLAFTSGGGGGPSVLLPAELPYEPSATLHTPAHLPCVPMSGGQTI